jgi:hypothetical protein
MTTCVVTARRDKCPRSNGQVSSVDYRAALSSAVKWAVPGSQHRRSRVVGFNRYALRTCGQGREGDLRGLSWVALSQLSCSCWSQSDSTRASARARSTDRKGAVEIQAPPQAPHFICRATIGFCRCQRRPSPFLVALTPKGVEPRSHLLATVRGRLWDYFRRGPIGSGPGTHVSFDPLEVTPSRDRLSPPGYRPTELAQKIGGFRKGNHFEAHIPGFVPYDMERLFAAFGVPRQRAVSKTETSRLVSAVDNSAGYEQVQRPEMCSGDHYCTWVYASVRRVDPETGPAVALPCEQAIFGSVPGIITTSDDRRRLLVVVAGWKVLAPGLALLGVGQGSGTQPPDELGQVGGTGPDCQDHLSRLTGQ